MNAFFLLISLTISSQSIDAAEKVRSWSIVRKEQGLMVNYVASVAEAPDGAVWFGTAAGVSRFDGRAWTHYSTENGLPGFLVSHIHIDEAGDVWAASGEGYPTFTEPWLAASRMARGKRSSCPDAERWSGRFWTHLAEGFTLLRGVESTTLTGTAGKS